MLRDPPPHPEQEGAPLIAATPQPRQLEAPFQHQLPQVSEQKKRAWEECALALFLFKIFKICLRQRDGAGRRVEGEAESCRLPKEQGA